MLKTARCLALLTLLSVAFATHPKAEAACFYPRAVTTTYYGMIDDAPGWEGTLWYCHEVIISPMHPHHWGVIGERIRDCDGNITTWGDTTSCTGPDNTETSSELCPLVCDE